MKINLPIDFSQKREKIAKNTTASFVKNDDERRRRRRRRRRPRREEDKERTTSHWSPSKNGDWSSRECNGAVFTTRHVFRVFLLFFKTTTGTTTTRVKKVFLLFLQIVFTPRRESDRDDSNAETNQSRGLLREIDLDSIIRGISRAARKLLEQIRSSPKQLSIKKAFFRKPSKILPYFFLTWRLLYYCSNSFSFAAFGLSKKKTKRERTSQLRWLAAAARRELRAVRPERRLLLLLIGVWGEMSLRKCRRSILLLWWMECYPVATRIRWKLRRRGRPVDKTVNSKEEEKEKEAIMGYTSSRGR